MQVFNVFFKIVRKNIGTILLYFTIFFIVSIIMTNLNEEQEKEQFEETKLSVFVVDESNSKLSNGLVDFLKDFNDVSFIPYDKEKIQNHLFYRDTDYVLLIPSDFDDRLIEGKENTVENIKIPQSISGVYVDRQVDSYLKNIKTLLDTKMTKEEAVKSAREISAVRTTVNMETKEKDGNSGIGELFYQYFAYAALALILSILTIVLMKLRKKDIAARTRISCLSSRKYDIQIVLASIAFSTVIWALFSLIPFFLDQSVGLFSVERLLQLLNSYIFAMVCTTAAVFLSAIINSEQTVEIVSNIAGLGMSFLCGIFVPAELLGHTVVQVSKALPAYWYVNANQLIKDYAVSSNLRTIFINMGVQLLFIVAFLAMIRVNSYLKSKQIAS